MLKSISLKCSNCGANLDITTEMSSFACGYCGASQIVERSGGTVSLRLLADGISKVQAGTDKTAAELAIRRLKEELQDIFNAGENLKSQHLRENFRLKQQYKTPTIIVSLICFVFLFQGGVVAVVMSLIWVASLIALFVYYSKNLEKNREEYARMRQNIVIEADKIQKRIEENKQIVGY